MSVVWLVWLEALAPVLVAQLPPPPTEDGPGQERAPRLTVVERKVDLGPILEGDKATVSWLLENRGDTDLIIERTKTSCGCATVKLTEAEKIIPPGGSLKLKTEFDSTRRRGEQTKSVTVYTNDPVEPTQKLLFTADIKTLYETRPPGIFNLGAVQRETPATRTLEIVPGKGRKSIEILDIELDEGTLLTYEWESFEEKGKIGQRVRFSPSKYEALGTISTQAKISLRVDDIDRTRTVKIRGEIVGDLTFLPRVVDATRQKSRRGRRLVPVMVRSTNENPFQIRSATAGSALDVSFKAKKGKEPNATQYVFTLTVRPDAPAGPFGTTLEVHTDSLDQPVVRVPVFGIIAPLVDVEPPVILLRQDGTPVGTTRRVKVQASPQDTLEIQEITCENKAVTAAVDVEASSRYHHLCFLEVRLTGELPPGIHETVLTLTTTVEGAERLDIPVTIDVPG